jgi:glycerol-3-phosphate dehydrogenase
MITDEKILILGAGKFGTCLAQHLAREGHKVTLFCRRQSVTEEINQNHVNATAHPDTSLNPNISATSILDAAALSEYSIIVNAIPVQAHRKLLRKIGPGLTAKHLYISVSKGIDAETGALPSQILAACAEQRVADNAVILFGPSFAEEVLAQEPTALVAACLNPEKAEAAQSIFHTNTLRVYTSQDPLGLEVSGALKNIIAIAAGAASGLGLQSNAKAALITRGLNEILKVGLTRGANPMTFLGLGGVGDLLLTCGSTQSRNYRVGYLLGQGVSLNEAIEQVGSVAEGVFTSKAAYRWVSDENLDCPIITQTYAILHESRDVKAAVTQLLNRPSTSEFDSDFLAQYFAEQAT